MHFKFSKTIYAIFPLLIILAISAVAVSAGTPAPTSTPTGLFGFTAPTGFAASSESDETNTGTGTASLEITTENCWKNPDTKNVPSSDRGECGSSQVLDFPSEYTGVTQIDIEATRGGAWGCKSWVEMYFYAYDNAGNKHLAGISDHMPSKSKHEYSFKVPNLNVKKVMAQISRDSGGWFQDACWYIDQFKATLTYTIPNKQPTATFVPSKKSGTAPLEVDFDASASSDPDDDPLTYEWEFGDGATGAEVKTSHEYQNKGTFIARLTVFDSRGAKSSFTEQISVSVLNKLPRALFVPSTRRGTVPLTVNFDASLSSDPEEGELTYEWEFGDGAAGTGEKISHAYQNIGTYTAKLTVTDDKGATSSVTSKIEVSTAKEAPIALFVVSPRRGTAPLTVNFDASSSYDPDGQIQTYMWDFGNGEEGLGEEVTYTYEESGEFEATLTVTDKDRLKATKTKTIRVSEPVVEPVEPVEPEEPTTTNTRPEAAFTSTATAGKAPLTVVFDAGASSDSDGDITNYEWNFGDGSAKLSGTYMPVAVHVYQNPGIYVAYLTITDDKGATGNAYQIITVSEKATVPPIVEPVPPIEPEPPIEPPVVEPPTKTVEVGLSEGWNLLSIPGDITSSENDCYSDPIVYFYIKENKEYSGKKNLGKVVESRADRSYGKSNAFWVKAESSCVVAFEVSNFASAGSIELLKGWNFVPITNDMYRKSLDDISGDCRITKAYLFDSRAQNWETADTSVRFTSRQTHTGMVVRSSNDCMLGEGGSEFPPGFE